MAARLVGISKLLGRSGGRHGLNGKVVAVYCRSPEAGGGVYEDVRIVEIGFNPFLVGRSVRRDPSHGNQWDEVENWIAVGDISRLMVFDDVEAARRAFASDDAPPE